MGAAQSSAVVVPFAQGVDGGGNYQAHVQSLAHAGVPRNRPHTLTPRLRAYFLRRGRRRLSMVTYCCCFFLSLQLLSLSVNPVFHECRLGGCLSGFASHHVWRATCARVSFACLSGNQFASTGKTATQSFSELVLNKFRIGVE